MDASLGLSCHAGRDRATGLIADLPGVPTSEELDGCKVRHDLERRGMAEMAPIVTPEVLDEQ